MFVNRLLYPFRCKQCGHEYVSCFRSYRVGRGRCYKCRDKTAEEAVAEIQIEIEEEKEWVEQEIAEYESNKDDK